jgi:hypothetical protein
MLADAACTESDADEAEPAAAATLTGRSEEKACLEPPGDNSEEKLLGGWGIGKRRWREVRSESGEGQENAHVVTGPAASKAGAQDGGQQSEDEADGKHAGRQIRSSKRRLSDDEEFPPSEGTAPPRKSQKS